MKLFTIGPVEMFEEVKNVRKTMDVPYFRTKEFSKLMLDTDALLKKFAKTSESSHTVYLTASGTAAMEATVMNCFSPEDKLLVINGGTFGKRFAEICEIHRIPYSEIKLKHDEKLSAEHFQKFQGEQFSGLLVNIHETSTGQLYDINLISEFCRQNNLYLVVDAISSFLCDPFDMDRYGIDVMITSSQKGLCVEPGMSVVLLNEKIVKDRVYKSNLQSLYFNFKIYFENFKRGQTPFSPAVGICMEINSSLHMIEKIGLKNHLKRIDNVAQDFREKIKKLPVTIPKYQLSNAITPMIFKEDIAYKIFEILKDEHAVVVAPTSGELSKKSLHISHVGNLNVSDNTMLVDLFQKVLSEL